MLSAPRPGGVPSRTGTSSGAVSVNVPKASDKKALPADGSTAGFIAILADMAQMYGATSHCDVTSFASMKREKRMRLLRKTRGSSILRELSLKFVNLDDHGSGVGYESAFPVLPQEGQISADKKAKLQKELESFESQPINVSFSRAGAVSIVCYSKLDNARDAPWQGLSEAQLKAMLPKTLTDKSGRRKSTSDDGGNLAADARIIQGFFTRARATARWLSAKKKIMAWRAFQTTPSTTAKPTPSAFANRRMSTTGAMAQDSPLAMLNWPQSKFIEKEIVKFMAKLEGVWGFVLVDAEKRQVIAARDRSGVVPLFGGLTKDNAAIFSTESGLLPDEANKVVNIAPGQYIYGSFDDISSEGTSY